ncbi:MULTISPECIES: hypothetical protein [Agathobacter]|uniref:hypothetical protein n=1 Tax=Agathobacter TaxID=1766253 RepID=UPI001FA85C0D|nr:MULTISPECIES: hypothetical protein [Agathobacter]MDC7301025.1 hypothetical protein [Agathobacter ruminis]
MKIRLHALFPMLLMVVVLAIFVYAANEVGQSQSTQETDILNKALNRSITQCYALEGAYPASLKYLVDHYGLTYDSEHYYIDYQYIGSNLRPDVTIIERH